MVSKTYFEFSGKIIPIGNSKGLILQTEILDYMELQNGEELTIAVQEGKHGKFIAIFKK